MDEGAEQYYRSLWSVPEIFAPMGDPAPGIVTTHDDFAVSFNADEARDNIAALLATQSEAEARRRFRLCRQDQWSYGRAKEKLASVDLDGLITPLTYRPFDDRWTVWDGNVAVHRRERVMRHLRAGHLALATSRQSGVLGSHTFDAVMAVTRPVDFNFFRRGGEYVFPIRLEEKEGVRENISANFRKFLDGKCNAHYAPEEILGYVYAVLHAPTYRACYAAFLRIDFPRIPFPERQYDFEALSKLGWALVEAHLLQPSLPRAGLADYQGRGDDRVEVVKRVGDEVRINESQGFGPIPDAIWAFRIGDYQVIDKYLKSRKGRVLTLDEIRHVARVCDALAFTIEQMQRIDQAYRAAFPELQEVGAGA